MKLSDRSPKDAATERGRIYKFLELPEAKGGGALELSSNAVGLPAVYRAMMGSLKVKSGREALKLLLIRLVARLQGLFNHRRALTDRSS